MPPRLETIQDKYNYARRRADPQVRESLLRARELARGFPDVGAEHLLLAYAQKFSNQFAQAGLSEREIRYWIPVKKTTFKGGKRYSSELLNVVSGAIQRAERHNRTRVEDPDLLYSTLIETASAALGILEFYHVNRLALFEACINNQTKQSQFQSSEFVNEQAS